MGETCSAVIQTHDDQEYIYHSITNQYRVHLGLKVCNMQTDFDKKRRIAINLNNDELLLENTVSEDFFYFISNWYYFFPVHYGLWHNILYLLVQYLPRLSLLTMFVFTFVMRQRQGCGSAFIFCGSGSSCSSQSGSSSFLKTDPA